MQNWAELGVVATLVPVVRNNNGREIKVGCVHIHPAEEMLSRRSRGTVGGAATATEAGSPGSRERKFIRDPILIRSLNWIRRAGKQSTLSSVFRSREIGKTRDSIGRCLALARDA